MANRIETQIPIVNKLLNGEEVATVNVNLIPAPLIATASILAIGAIITMLIYKKVK